ncbi:MAG TPA: zinc ribbon domain-containing protein [Roseiflexaceae bacterium]|nr:zinc ribbon domain-containing protein [Roseiflexaceae bacterium]
MPFFSHNAPTPGCATCGADLPAGARFCIECGEPAAAGTATVRLANARVAQSVIGGTIKLPNSGAFPPGIWPHEPLPGEGDVVAVYAPLRAVVKGWSGLVSLGWKQVDRSIPEHAEAGTLYRFECVRDWFGAPGAARGLHLRVRIRALAEAEPGRTRQGFRYRTYHDAPMEVAEAWWHDPHSGRRQDFPVPEIQIMAPPRVARVSDADEQIQIAPRADALAWAREGKFADILHLPRNVQQRTPVGRGLVLGVAGSADLFRRLFGSMRDAYVMQVFQPLVINLQAWPRLQQQIQSEAAALGLDMDSDAVVEWGLDRRGHDCVLFEGAYRRYNYERVLIAFRRSQIARVEGEQVRG